MRRCARTPSAADWQIRKNAARIRDSGGWDGLAEDGMGRQRTGQKKGL
ncbi:MAG: hypothetical protein KH128_03450 [Firmicutes bacterium]|nr:hypothetical protein [Bacillota bacterium]